MDLEDIKLNKDIVTMVSHIKRKGLDDKYNIDDISKALIELYDNRNIVMEQNHKLKSSLQNHRATVQKNIELSNKLVKVGYDNKDYINEQVDKKVEKELKSIEFNIATKYIEEKNSILKNNIELKEEMENLQQELDIWKIRFTEQASANAKLINKYINKE